MTFLRYMKANAGEFVLVVLSAWAVAVVGMNAFFLDSLVQSIGYFGRALMALFAVIILIFALYAASWRRQRLALGVVLYVMLVAVIIVAAIAMSNGENPYADAEGNYVYLALLLVFCATGSFMLTRTLAGSAVWFVAAAVSCSAVQAFYDSGELVMSAVAGLSALVLIVHRNFRLGLEKAESAQSPSHAGIFVSSITPVLAVGALALIAWFVVIAPLSPNVMKVTLFNEYKRLPIGELKGTADEHPVLNFDMTSQNLIDGFYYTTDDLLEDPSSSVTIDATSLLEQQLQQQVESQNSGDGSSSGTSSRESLDPLSTDAEIDSMSWSIVFPWIVVGIIVALLILLAIVAYFVGRRIMRTRKLRNILARPSPREQVEQLYLFLLGRLERLGFKVPAGMTLAEYADASKRRMDMLTEETKVPFVKLTETYQSCVYGKHEPTDDEIVPFVAYYLSFWRAARTYLGNLRYFFRSFRL